MNENEQKISALLFIVGLNFLACRTSIYTSIDDVAAGVCLCQLLLNSCLGMTDQGVTKHVACWKCSCLDTIQRRCDP